MATLGNNVKLEIGETTKKIVGRITNVGAVEQSIAKVDVTAVEDTHKKNIPGGVIETSDIAIEGFYIKDDVGQIALVTTFVSKLEETFTITYSDGAKFVLKGFITNLISIGEATNEEALPFSATIAVTGAPTFTAAT